MGNALINGWKLRNGDAMKDILIEEDKEAQSIEISHIDEGKREYGISLARDPEALDALIEILSIIKGRM